MKQNFFRELTSGFEGKEILLEGLRKSCNIVGATMGYRGSNNMFEQISGLPLITSDGWDSLQELFWEDPIESQAVNILKECCKKTFEIIGDNTTTTCVLTLAFFENSVDALRNGKSAIEIKEEIEKSVDKICDYIDSIAIPLDKKLTYDVAKTSTHGSDELAQIITDAYEQAGEFGVVSHERSYTDETYIKKVEGHPVEAGFTNEMYINNPTYQTCEFDNPMVLLSMNQIKDYNQIAPFIAKAFENNKRTPVVLFSEIDHHVENIILHNVSEFKFPICVVRLPAIGILQREIMNDLSLLFNCEILPSVPTVDFQGMEEKYIGNCKSIKIGANDVSFLKHDNFENDKVTGKINELNSQIKVNDSKTQKIYLKKRVARLTGGIATIMVGGITPSEVEEKVARVDDAICAVRSAKDGGVVGGGGIALYSASMNLDLDEVTKKSIISPFDKIISNANASMKIDGNLFYYPIGYDVKEYKEVNMIEAGIIDTAKGIKASLRNAASASNNLIRTDNCITFKR